MKYLSQYLKTTKPPLTTGFYKHEILRAWARIGQEQSRWKLDPPIPSRRNRFSIVARNISASVFKPTTASKPFIFFITTQCPKPCVLFNSSECLLKRKSAGNQLHDTFLNLRRSLVHGRPCRASTLQPLKIEGTHRATYGQVIEELLFPSGLILTDELGL